MTAVVVKVGEKKFELDEAPATVLAEKLRLFASGHYPADTQLLAAEARGRDWLLGARDMADAIEAALTRADGRPIDLHGVGGEAVLQVLRISYTEGGMTALRVALEAELAHSGDP